MNSSVSTPAGRPRRWRLVVLAVLIVLVAVGVYLALHLGGRATPLLDTIGR